MTVAQVAGGPRLNTILGALPDDEFGRLASQLEPVELERGAVLEHEDEEITHVYFPITGMASLVAVGIDGEVVDTTMVGHEGMTGLPVFLGTGQMPVRTIVQLPLTGMRLRSEALRDELRHGGRLVTLLQRYTQVVMVSMAQLVLCNRMHHVEQRAARWLLQVHERVEEAPFDVTQEFLAEMIGVQRPTLSVVVRQFKDQGLIGYTRGKVRILDANRLLGQSCGCIAIMHAEERRLRDTAERVRLGS